LAAEKKKLERGKKRAEGEKAHRTSPSKILDAEGIRKNNARENPCGLKKKRGID